MEGGETVLIVAEIFDELVMPGSENGLEQFSDPFNMKVDMGSQHCRPGTFRFYEINLTEKTDLTLHKNSNEKCNGLTPYPIGRHLRKQYDETLNAVEKSSFESTKSVAEWIETAASPFSSFYTSYLQQKVPNLRVHHFIEQTTIGKNSKN